MRTSCRVMATESKSDSGDGADNKHGQSSTNSSRSDSAPAPAQFTPLCGRNAHSRAAEDGFSNQNGRGKRAATERRSPRSRFALCIAWHRPESGAYVLFALVTRRGRRVNGRVVAERGPAPCSAILCAVAATREWRAACCGQEGARRGARSVLSIQLSVVAVYMFVYRVFRCARIS